MPHLDHLRQLAGDLSLQLILGEPGTQDNAGAPQSWTTALENIRGEAVLENAAEVAAAAESLIKILATAGESPDCSAGMARLQQALDDIGFSKARPENSLALDPELMLDFILESREHLVNIESQVLTLEREPGDSEALNSVFRGFHTIKGLAGFLEIWQIQEFAHEVETLLDRARNSELMITPAAIDAILESADYLSSWMAHLDSTLQNQPSEAPRRDESLLARICELSSAVAGLSQPHAALAALAAAVEAEKEPIRTEIPLLEPLAAVRSERRNENMAVKVDTAKLDYLVDMAGEMVIAESLVRHDPEIAATKNPRLQRNIAQLTRITAELQKTAMAMRLVPIGPLFQRMARLVRDLSRQCGKQVGMETEGDEIQLDRTIVEELADPLMHMVRNAIDHGIETPLERQQAGKNPAARLLLKAQHQAGQVVIEIEDDGRGLDRARIAAKAFERGLISSGETLPESEVYNLIFEPGFSTAAQITNVSGRGVGMDVVRKHIEKLRGRIEIRSTQGQGAAFSLKLPLTLAIIDGLVVGIGPERYIVPLFAIREMFRPGADVIWTVQQRAEMALVRGVLLPVLRLYKKFGITPRSEDPLQSVLVVAEVGGQRFCILVDELIGKQEVMIKSLGETFQNVPGIAGGAILGDGRVGLILDLEQLFKGFA